MSRIEGTVIIKSPADKVFAYTTEAKSWPKWHGAIPEAEQTSKGQMGVGTTFRGKSRMMGQTSEWTAKMTEYEPYKRWGKVIDSGSLVIDDKLVCDPAEGGTRLTMVYEVKVGGILKLLSPMIISSMRKQLKLDLASLKAILEAQA
jgi:Polyketide cyclase / dehydrase and lipid transport